MAKSLRQDNKPMRAIHQPRNLLLLAVLLLSACTTAVTTPIPAQTATSVPLHTPTEPPTVTLEPTSTGEPTGEPADPQQNLENAAKEAGIPLEIATQFGNIEYDSTGLWHINGNIDESDLQLNTGIQAGDILIGATTKLYYVNAEGEADWVYIPAISFHISQGQTVVGANMVNHDGAALASRLTGDTSKVRDFIVRYFDRMGSVAAVSFGFPGSGHPDIITAGFFDSAISELYTQEMIEEFMRTGASSLLPHRLLIPVDIAPNSGLAGK